jgi:hypothetical protein
MKPVKESPSASTKFQNTCTPFSRQAEKYRRHFYSLLMMMHKSLANTVPWVFCLQQIKWGTETGKLSSSISFVEGIFKRRTFNTGSLYSLTGSTNIVCSLFVIH